MPRVKKPNPEEEAEIARGIASDPDTWVPTDSEWTTTRPVADVDPALAEASKETGRLGSIRQFHVLPLQSGWAVRKVGANASEMFANKSDAIERARSLAEASNVEWVEYRRDGTVRDIHRRSEHRRRHVHG